jgi:hypothetical protein
MPRHAKSRAAAAETLIMNSKAQQINHSIIALADASLENIRRFDSLRESDLTTQTLNGRLF